MSCTCRFESSIEPLCPIHDLAGIARSADTSPFSEAPHADIARAVAAAVLKEAISRVDRERNGWAYGAGESAGLLDAVEKLQELAAELGLNEE